MSKDASPAGPTPRQRSLVDRQAELLALQRRLSRTERLAALGALAGRLAHELGTPLHSIGGHLDLLLADPRLPPELQERVEVVAGQVDRLSRLIRGHLRSLHAPEPEPKPCNLNAIVANIAELIRPICERAGVQLQLDLDGRVAQPFSCDASQIEQVLLNLVQNALDAMPDGGQLVLRSAAATGACMISVCDSGCGIAEDVIERVFEPFFTTKAPGRGTGFGLGLCREIARRHGGDIVLDSKQGEGTVVTLTLGSIPGEEA